MGQLELTLSKVTERAIAALPATGQQYRIRHPDSRYRYLRLIVTAKGTKNWYVRKRPKGQKPVAIKICEHGQIPMSEVYKKYGQIVLDLENGINPLQKQAEIKDCWTVKMAFEHKREQSKREKRKNFAKYEQHFKRYLAPISERRLNSLTSRELTLLINSIADSAPEDQPRKLETANRTRILLSSLFNLNNSIGPIPTPNIVKDIKPLFIKNPNRETVWSPEELAKIEKQIEVWRETYPHWADFFFIALKTGLRRGNIYKLEPKEIEVHEDKVMLKIDGTKMKSGKQFYVPVHKSVEGVLKRLKDKAGENQYVFHSRLSDCGHISGVWGRFKKFCTEAGVQELPFHTLRHCCISNWVSLGLNAFVIQKLAGHAKISTTQRYVKINTDSLIKALDY
jgi:integrase